MIHAASPGDTEGFILLFFQTCKQILSCRTTWMTGITLKGVKRIRSSLHDCATVLRGTYSEISHEEGSSHSGASVVASEQNWKWMVMDELTHSQCHPDSTSSHILLTRFTPWVMWPWQLSHVTVLSDSPTTAIMWHYGVIDPEIPGTLHRPVELRGPKTVHLLSRQ